MKIFLLPEEEKQDGKPMDMPMNGNQKIKFGLGGPRKVKNERCEGPHVSSGVDHYTIEVNNQDEVNDDHNSENNQSNNNVKM